MTTPPKLRPYQQEAIDALTRRVGPYEISVTDEQRAARMTPTIVISTPGRLFFDFQVPPAPASDVTQSYSGTFAMDDAATEDYKRFIAEMCDTPYDLLWGNLPNPITPEDWAAIDASRARMTQRQDKVLEDLRRIMAAPRLSGTVTNNVSLPMRGATGKSIYADVAALYEEIWPGPVHSLSGDYAPLEARVLGKMTREEQQRARFTVTDEGETPLAPNRASIRKERAEQRRANKRKNRK